MKKLLSIFLIAMLVTATLVACGKDEEPASETNTSTEKTDDKKVEEKEEEKVEENNTETDASTYVDGIYYAESDEFSPNNGWKDFVVVEVKDGKIVRAEWNATNIVPQGDKVTVSKEGGYPMVAAGGAQSEWYEQAKAAEEWLLESQDPTAITLNDEGKTDAIAGVSIHVNNYFALVEKALASEAVPNGQYTDGVFTSSLDPDDKGYAYAGEFVVVNGTIVSANFNASKTDEEGNVTNKKSLGYDYGMKNAGSELEWFEQAEAVEAFVIESQGFDIEMTEGKTDAIAGVSIHVNAFEELFTTAVQK